MWNGLPVIRREIAASMVKDFKLTQKEVAEKLGVTPAAVCQYLAKKRGKLEIKNDEILKEIKIAAKNIIINGEDSVISETCRICKLIRSMPEFDLFCSICDE